MCGDDLSTRRDHEPFAEIIGGEIEHTRMCYRCIDTAENDYAESLHDEFPENLEPVTAYHSTCVQCGQPSLAATCDKCEFENFKRWEIALT
jgi:NAD-dependent dihydropyrimidine dehydrogenase PreA subunit